MAKVRKKKKIRSAAKPSWLAEEVEEIKDWAAGRVWWPRLLLLLLFAHITVMHMKDPMSSDIFKGLNLAIHEMGHMVFSPMGEFMTVAGGSLFQCLVPLLSTIMFWRQRDYFGIAVCFFWLSTNLFDVAIYAADARTLALPLVSPFKGEETIHDWNWLLDKTNMLHQDYMVASVLRLMGVISSLICLALGSWLIYLMAKTPAKVVDGAEESVA